ncbi:MAG TPA: tail fiber domain-containing protein [Rhodothermales bacterium]
MSYLKSILVLFFVISPLHSVAQNTKAPDSLSFQGRLTDPSGVAIDTPSVAMTFKLYKGGVEIWSETHPGVAVEGGVFNVLLGGTTPLDTMAFNTPFELGVTVGADPEIVPRTTLGAAAYAKALPGLYTFHRSVGNYQSHTVIGGFTENFVASGAVGATIGGGGGLTFEFPFPNSVLGIFGTVSGGLGNVAGDVSTVGGGNGNVAHGLHATIAGGEVNTASAIGSVVGGGRSNEATAIYSTVPGGEENHAHADYSLAAGYNAKAHHKGSFVWNDRSQTDFDLSDSLSTTADNQFLIRAAGGVGIGTNAPATQLSVAGSADVADSLGVGTSELEAPLHVQINDLDVGAGELAREGLMVEKDDAIIGAYSGPGGTWGSALVLAEMTGGNLISKWALVRETIGAGNDLHFKYGASDLYEANATQFEIRNTGEAVTSGDLLPDTDNAHSLGQNGLVWTEVFASSGVVSTSDRRLKTDIQELTVGLEELMQLEPVSYRRRDRSDDPREIGLIAQDVEEIVPEVVRHPTKPGGHYGLNYSQLVPVLIKAVQEQQITIRAQQEEIDVLKNLYSDLAIEAGTR